MVRKRFTKAANFFLHKLETTIYTKVATSLWSIVVFTQITLTPVCTVGGEGLTAATATLTVSSLSASRSPPCLRLHRHCPDSRRTFTKRLMLEKHIQLMHGIKDPDLKEMTEATNEEEIEIKEDTKVRHGRCSLYGRIVLTCFFHSFFSFKTF